MKISCLFAPTSRTPDHIQLAEALGYDGAYCYDSPALGPDLYVTLALAAERTETIGLGTGVMVPRLRHVLTTAASFATLNRLAPGRLTMGVGSGFTGSRLLGQPAMRWKDVLAYVQAVKALLRGEEVWWDGATISFVPSADFEKSLPVDLPVIVAADGPKGRQVAKELGAGISVAVASPQEGFDWVATTVCGTVLDDGESPESDRVFAAVGPFIALKYHVLYVLQGAAGIDAMPGGRRWRERIEAIPEERRHLEIHRGHGHVVSELDREFIPRKVVAERSATGSADDVYNAVADLGRLGVTEVLYTPGGDDIPRELERFADAVMSLKSPSTNEKGKPGLDRESHS